MTDPDNAGVALLAQLVSEGYTNTDIAAVLRMHPVTIGRLTAKLRQARPQGARCATPDPRWDSTVHYWRPAR